MKQNPTPLKPQDNFNKFNLISWLEKDLITVPGLQHDHITTLCRKMFPVENSQNVYVALYKTMLQYFSIQINKGQTYDSAAAEIIRLALPINENLSKTISAFLNKEMIKGKFQLLLSRNANQDTQKKPSTTGLLETLQLKYTGNNKASKEILKKGFDTYHKHPPQTTGEISEKYIKQRHQIQNLKAKKETPNHQLCIMCQKSLSPTDMVFQCEDCGETFHKKCQNRKNNCIFCQLKNMNPLRRTKKQLFFGFLKKGVKKHDIEFLITEEDSIIKEVNNKNGPGTCVKRVLPNVEIRCLRIKDYYDQVCNYINLFPDACTVMANQKLIKQFIPLHRQSSLKYRRDDAVKITNHINLGLNKVTITERFLSKDVKADQRVEIQNHLVGIYIVEEWNIPKKANIIEQFLMKNPISSKTLSIQGVSNNDQEFMKDTEVLTFRESQKMLKDSLMLSHEQDIECDQLNAPLVCSLTLGRMSNPGRTIFCKHFSCFDVKNFFLVNSKAQLPRWQCPICKVPAYKFKIDCILNEIIRMFSGEQSTRKEENQPTQVVFQKDFRFKVISKDGKVLNPKENGKYFGSIYDLPIEGVHKRFREESESNVEKDDCSLPKKRVKENSEMERNNQYVEQNVIKDGLDSKIEGEILERQKSSEIRTKIQQKISEKFGTKNQKKVSNTETQKEEQVSLNPAEKNQSILAKIFSFQARESNKTQRQGKLAQEKLNHTKDFESNKKGAKSFVLPDNCEVVDLSD